MVTCDVLEGIQSTVIVVGNPVIESSKPPNKVKRNLRSQKKLRLEKVICRILSSFSLEC